MHTDFIPGDSANSFRFTNHKTMWADLWLECLAHLTPEDYQALRCLFESDELKRCSGDAKAFKLYIRDGIRTGRFESYAFSPEAEYFLLEAIGDYHWGSTLRMRNTISFFASQCASPQILRVTQKAVVENGVIAHKSVSLPEKSFTFRKNKLTNPPYCFALGDLPDQSAQTKTQCGFLDVFAFGVDQLHAGSDVSEGVDESRIAAARFTVDFRCCQARVAIN